MGERPTHSTLKDYTLSTNVLNHIVLRGLLRKSHLTYYVATVVKPSLLRDYGLYTVIVTV